MDKQELREQAGQKLKEIRKGTGLSIFKIGRRIGVSGGYISQIERGIRPPSDAVLCSLAEVYEVEKQTLFDLYRRVENEELSAYIDNPIARKTFAQISANKKLSDEQKERLMKELQETIDRHFGEEGVTDV